MYNTLYFQLLIATIYIGRVWHMMEDKWNTQYLFTHRFQAHIVVAIFYNY